MVQNEKKYELRDLVTPKVVVPDEGYDTMKKVKLDILVKNKENVEFLKKDFKKVEVIKPPEGYDTMSIVEMELRITVDSIKFPIDVINTGTLFLETDGVYHNPSGLIPTNIKQGTIAFIVSIGETDSKLCYDVDFIVARTTNKRISSKKPFVLFKYEHENYLTLDSLYYNWYSLVSEGNNNVFKFKPMYHKPNYIRHPNVVECHDVFINNKFLMDVWYFKIPLIDNNIEEFISSEFLNEPIVTVDEEDF